jgi:hypothetical protein
MSSRVLRWGGGAAIAAAFTLLSATPSFAPHIAQLQVNPAQAKAGEEVTVFGPRGYGRFTPVEVRFGSPTGPVLGTFTPNEESYAMWGPGTVRIPEGTAPGVYSLYATQTLTAADSHIRGVPARGEITVLGTGGTPVLGATNAPALPDQSGPGLVEDEPVSTGTIALVALGVAGVGMFLAGGAALFASRRRSAQPVARA